MLFLDVCDRSSQMEIFPFGCHTASREIVGAVYEGVNEMGDRTLPLLARRGGRDIKKVAKHRKGADGVVVQIFCSRL
jgi:hypothetical protein